MQDLNRVYSAPIVSGSQFRGYILCGAHIQTGCVTAPQPLTVVWAPYHAAYKCSPQNPENDASVYL